MTGGFILVVSLTAVSPVLSSTEDARASQRSFYLDDTILPDHVAYPFVMVADRIQLETASPEEKTKLQIEYSLRRLHYAESLLQKNKTSLALTTLTKSQKYLIHASQDAINAPLSPAETLQLVLVLTHYRAEVDRLGQQFTGADRVVVDSLITELWSLEEQLRRQIDQL